MKINDVIARRIKFSTVAIGIRNYTKNFVDIIGSGFYYDTRGYLFSAGHVLRSARKIQTSYRLKNHESEIVAINNHIRDGNKVTVEADKIEFDDILLPSIPTQIQNPTAPVIPDLGIAKVQKQRDQYPFLKIRTTDVLEKPIDMGEEVVLCGYPAGEQSLSLQVTKDVGLRFSPVMQFGHIAALLPSDDSIPYGLQTDILSTGGSSGSAIVSVETGEVLAIAQKIIVTYAGVDVPEKAQKKARLPEQLSGFAHVGIVWGDSFNMFSDVVNMTEDDFSKGINGFSKKSHTKGFVRSELMNDGVIISKDDL
jgi:S1-C subfamily serine protease